MKVHRIQYYMNIAKSVAQASSCARRKFGAVIIKNNAIVSTGYNGSARKATNCGTEIECLKNLYDEKSYLSYNYCPAIHAEQNAIINASRVGTKVFDSTLFLSTSDGLNGDRPCYLCRRMMINAGIKDCYYINSDGKIIHEEVGSWVKLENIWIKKILEAKTK